ncbi:MAG TPA: O-antigen ligase family protein [Usitatibacter sp.]|nr:O-antigen ligase family protein [Usitatibacter sp.]
MKRTSRYGGLTWAALGALLTGVAAIAALILAQQGNPKYVFVGFTALIVAVLMPLIGNFRLFCLYSILMLAPLGLRLTFVAYPHMGGAGALYLEAIDPFLLALLFFQVRDRVRGFRGTFRFPLALVLFAMLMGLAAAVTIFASFRTLAFLELVRMLKVLLLALVVLNEVVRRRDFGHAIGALVLGVILEAGIALTQNVTGAQLGLGFLGESSDEDIDLLGKTTLEGGEFVYRAGGLLGHSNLLAAYLALLLPLTIAILLSPASRLLKALALVALLLGQPALVLTLSRGGWLDFLVGLALVLALGALHPASRRMFMFARVSIIVAVLVIGAALSPMIIKRLSQADPSSVKYRLEWIRTAWAMIGDNPVFGVGLNTYVYSQIPYGEFKTPGEMTEFYGEIWPAVHNNWLLVWSEQGSLGFLLWVAFHLAVIAAAVRNLRIRDPVMHALGVGLIGGFAAIMVDGIASFFVRQEATARMFWIVTALILALDYWRRLNEEEDVSQQPAALASPERLKAPQETIPAGRWLPVRSSFLR